MMLAGTGVGSLMKLEKNFDMKTGFRILPKMFWFFNINNNDYTVAEIEEICISNSTLSFSDY